MATRSGRLDEPLPVSPARAAVAAARGRVELAAYGGVTAVALALRLLALDEKPLHHDESVHASISWWLATGQGYQYDPAYHGPVQFLLMAAAHVAVGAGEWSVRLAPALAGTALVFLPYFLRRRLGSVAALAAACFLCVSPSFLYFSRFAREDVYAVGLTLALVAATFAFLHRPRPLLPAVIAGLLAVSFATKETTYITVFVAGTFFLALLSHQLRRQRRSGRPFGGAPLVHAVRSVGLDAWLWAGATFVFVFTVLFTTAFWNPAGVVDGFYESIRYWLSQHDVRRGDQPPFFYLVLLAGYEWPLVVLALGGVAAALRRRRDLDLFLVWTAVGSLVVYSWAGERMPWLVLHPLLPLVLLAGLGVEAGWRARRLVLRAGTLAVFLLGGAFLVHASVGVAYRQPADARELLVFTQSADDVVRVRDELVALDRRIRRDLGRPLRVAVDGWGGAAWPWAWYLRELEAAYPAMDSPDYRPSDEDVIVVADPNHERLRPALARYQGRRFSFRVWWVPAYGELTPERWLRWVLGREAWSETGSLDEWIYVRRGLARGDSP
jgi:uncharacterized protein (TIGR03663 family)